ncbi:hypothetical protein ACFS3C_26850 [Azotobacter vinelandii]
MQNKEFHVSAYDFNNADGDDALFTIATDITDFVKVTEAIDDGFNNQHAKNYEELLNSWAYIALFEKDGKRLFAWRKNQC